jgi:glycosyltransferase involved in cell wall biosynthesis
MAHLRTEKHSMLCSIIIVCKNNLAEVERTLSSVRADKDFTVSCECIIVDDSYNDEIERYINDINLDNVSFYNGDKKSLYTAMNIGIQKSSGKYVWFLNSGDTRYPSFEIIKLNNLHADIIYGNTKYLRNNIVVSEQSWPSFHLSVYKQLRNTLPCHQSILFRREFLKNNGIEYSTELYISGDYYFIRNCVDKKASIYYLPEFVSEFTLGGISNKYTSIKMLLLHAHELRITRSLSWLEYVYLTLKLCKKLVFKKR